MDLQTCLLCIVLVILSGAILLFISMFGMKEKTYEEAIAEQRKMPHDALLLGRPSKDKSKNKKQKRQGKKVKEKSGAGKVVNNKLNVKNRTLSATKAKRVHKVQDQNHVNFSTPEVEVLNDFISIDQSSEKNKKSKDKVKPILLNKKESAPVKEKSIQRDLTINNLNENYPKDVADMKLTASKNNQNLKKSPKDQANTKENLTDKGLKVKEKTDLKAPLKEINNKVESEKNYKNESNKENKTDNLKIEKIKSDNKLKEDKAKVEKVKDVKMKIEKVKDEKSLNNDRIKNEKVKNEEQKVQQQPTIQQKQQIEIKQMKAELNGNLAIPPVERAPLQMKKLNTSQHQMNNKEVKNKNHKKNELISLQHMMDRDSVNINLLIPLIRKAELSRSEVQILTDILLTKHLDEVTDHFEWIEGRQDPVVKLKKQLAEKEKALSEEQEASQAFQNKLKELRSEFNAERARLTQACRQYDETILAKQGEIQNLHATNRHLLDSHVAEKQALTQKIQQLQAQVNDESLVIRKLQEDHNQTQNALQQELVNQGQQMEMHVERLSEQLQEAQKNFEAQIHSKIQEADNLRVSFNAELQKNRRHEEELRELREQQVQSQSKIKSLESRASQLKESSSHTPELIRQIEELQRVNKDLEMRYSTSLKLEEELKFEKNKLQKEGHDLTTKIFKLQDDCENLRQECGKLMEKYEKVRTANADLENDFQRVKDENKCLISQVSTFTKVEREAQRLREENENLAAQVTAFTERPAADGRENGDSPYSEEKKQNINVEFINHETEKQKDVVIERLANELKQKEIQLEKLHSQLDGSESEITRLTSEVADYKTEIPKLREELEAQRSKNNDLRKKNWKAMEALAASEKTLEDNQRQTEKSIQAQLKEEQEASKNLLQRIFPSIKVNAKVYEDWLNEFEKSAKNYVEQLKNSEEKSSQSDSAQIEELENKNNQLQTLIVYYKTIIEDTEGMLKKLQSHIEQEEIRWRQQCDGLEVQIQSQKNEVAALESEKEKLELKVKELESKNGGGDQAVQQENNELRRTTETQAEKCKNLSEEIDGLTKKLAEEEEKNKELNKEVVKLRSTVKFGQDAYVEENKKRLELEDEIKLLKSENIRDLPINSSGDFVAFEKGGFERQ